MEHHLLLRMLNKPIILILKLVKELSTLAWMDLLKLEEIPILLVRGHKMVLQFGMENLLNVAVEAVPSSLSQKICRLEKIWA